MTFIELFTDYLYVLRYIALGLMVIMLIFAIDDLFIDIYYWTRRLWRALVVYRKREPFNEQALLKLKEKPLAIMIPAWQEVGVVGKMAELAASELDYENYQIFVGSYPNDTATQADVDAVCQRFPNVHKVVCARPGPTSKADCLNNVIASILSFEDRTRVKFAGFIMHDAEDVVSAMELRLFNHLLERKDLIQLPVYPFSKGPWHFTAGHYLDEFSEMHGKDMVVRESLVGQVPSAGVGTCFSRRAILKLTEEGDGLPFDVQSLTEDYDIGFRMKQWGMEEIFVHFSVSDDKYAPFAESSRSRSEAGGNVVCVREYFPETLTTSVRQKSRWIVGIVFQGMQIHKWSSNWKLNYFLWRDRKGVIAHFVSFFATIIAIHVIGLMIYDALDKDGYRFMSLFKDDYLSILLVQVNFVFFLNRIFQRMIFVRRYYGIVQALVSPLRLLWGNLINFLANLRAIKQVIEQGGNPKRVAWDKTEHVYPTVSDRSLGLSVGRILTANGIISEAQLQQALEQRAADEKLGQTLLRLEHISSDQLGQTLAEQASVDFEHVDPFSVSDDIIQLVPARVALRYRVFPIRLDNGRLIVASENRQSPVAIASLERQLEQQVSYVICQAGAVTLGLRFHYQQIAEADPRPVLDKYAGQLSAEQRQRVLDKYYNQQIQFGDALQQVGLIETPIFNQLMFEFDPTGEQKLGDFMVERYVITPEVVEEVLTLQRQRQRSIEHLVEDVTAQGVSV
ncbi:glycosyl transferase family protein [Alteromonas sp. ASW11-36]|uniref:Glycosyl transferase family protein n=1 Tax=Alteromonas arenosi TaxID=3055817 RepID=A0ABT7SUL2_9ALTE|nr:glycosyl transferase family protein [Alteromonas sp. ASW11-36]MDM7859885.1 glycosyl transferase family protein [Alteromonas sp. ASW11-36]